MSEANWKDRIKSDIELANREIEAALEERKRIDFKIKDLNIIRNFLGSILKDPGKFDKTFKKGDA